MRAAGADHQLDLGNACRALGQAYRLACGTPQIERIEQRRYRRADRGPVRRLLVARPKQRLAQ
jgi:hypothetical protein